MLQGGSFQSLLPLEIKVPHTRADAQGPMQPNNLNTWHPMQKRCSKEMGQMLSSKHIDVRMSLGRGRAFQSSMQNLVHEMYVLSACPASRDNGSPAVSGQSTKGAEHKL